MRESFGGFPTLSLPSARVVLARERTFANLQKLAMTVAFGIRPVVSLPPMNRGYFKIVAGGLANPGLTTDATAIDLLAVSGLSSAQVIGRARLTTDQNNDVAALQSIAANTPVLFEMDFWPSVDDRLNCRGLSRGGLVASFTGTALAGATGLPSGSFVTTADVVDGPIDLVILAVTATSAAFTLDFVKVIEYPDAIDMPY